MISFLVFLITLISVTAFMPWVGRSYWYPLKLLSRYPWHASCVVTWTIPTSCDHFKTRIINQMNAWKVEDWPHHSPFDRTLPLLIRKFLIPYCFYWYQDLSDVGNEKFWFQGEELCPGTSEDCPSLPCGQNCLYNFTSYADQTISGTHQTPKHRLVERWLLF